MRIRIHGTIRVHALHLTVPFRTEHGRVVLGVDLDISDQQYHMAALIIAKELNLPVEWQDIVGLLHTVSPNSTVEHYDSMFDPRFAMNSTNEPIN